MVDSSSDIFERAARAHARLLRVAHDAPVQRRRQPRRARIAIARAARRACLRCAVRALGRLDETLPGVGVTLRRWLISVILPTRDGLSDP